MSPPLQNEISERVRLHFTPLWNVRVQVCETQVVFTRLCRSRCCRNLVRHPNCCSATWCGMLEVKGRHMRWAFCFIVWCRRWRNKRLLSEAQRSWPCKVDIEDIGQENCGITWTVSLLMSVFYLFKLVNQTKSWRSSTGVSLVDFGLSRSILARYIPIRLELRLPSFSLSQ